MNIRALVFSVSRYIGGENIHPLPSVASTIEDKEYGGRSASRAALYHDRTTRTIETGSKVVRTANNTPARTNESSSYRSETNI